MTRDKAIFSAVLFLLMIGIPSQASAQRLHEKLSDAHLLQTLRSLGYRDVEVLDNLTDADGSMIRFQIDHDPIFIQNYKSGSIRIFTYYINEEGVTRSTLSAVNAFNRDYRWAKAYLDADGDWLLEADYDIQSGVSDKAVEDFIALWAQQIDIFLNVIEK